MLELEKYIKENHSEFDQIEGPDNEALLWIQISENLPVKTKPKVVSIFRNRYVQLAIAASFGLMIGLSTWLFYPANQGNNLQNSNNLFLAQYAPELAEREEGYIRLIAQKESEINFQEINPKDYQDLFRELEALDFLREDYLQDIDQALGNDQFIQTLIRFYERKINLLERLSFEIRKNNKHEKRKEMQL